jgi:putative Ca2+/H+ antiporter (TMEM165/GDT1 family)
MSIIITSIASVALAEIGDKTQLLTLLLVARFGKPFHILFGIIIATLVNHFFAAGIGELVNQWLSPEIMRWIVGIGFLIMAAWLLIPDKNDGKIEGGHPFWTSLVVFFIAEIGDKTQIATLLLGAHYNNLTLVVLGSTIGMVLANAPMLWFGQRLQPYMQCKTGRYSATALFAALGIATIFYV